MGLEEVMWSGGRLVRLSQTSILRGPRASKDCLER